MPERLVRRVTIEPTIAELRLIVGALVLNPRAAELYRRLAGLLHFETMAPTPGPAECRRVLVRSARDGAESCIEYYDPHTCDLVDAAIERALRQKRQALRRRRA